MTRARVLLVLAGLLVAGSSAAAPVAPAHASTLAPAHASTLAPAAVDDASPRAAAVAHATRGYGALTPLVDFVRGLRAAFTGDAADAGSRATPPERAPTAARVAPPRATGWWRVLHDVLHALLALLRHAVPGAFAVLHHRVAPARLLEHPTRARILATLRTTPGLHVNALARAVDAHPKTLIHHLRLLAGAGRLRLVRDGKFLRAFPEAAPRARPPDSPVRARLLALVASGEATTRAGLARHLALTPQAVSHHVRALAAEGRVRVAWHGNRHHYRVPASDRERETLPAGVPS